jgi:hypothetical protein
MNNNYSLPTLNKMPYMKRMPLPYINGILTSSFQDMLKKNAIFNEQLRTPTTFIDPLTNVRVREYYRNTNQQTVGSEIGGRVLGMSIGGGAGAGAGTVIGGLVGGIVGGVTTGGPGVVPGIKAGASLGAMIGAGIGGLAGVASADYSTYYATLELLNKTLFSSVNNFKDLGVSGLNTLITVGRTLDQAMLGESIRASIYSLVNGEDALKNIVKSYGFLEEGKEVFDFYKIRESLGINLGNTGNTIIDLIGDLFTDPGFVAGTVGKLGSWLGTVNATKKQLKILIPTMQGVKEVIDEAVIENPKTLRKLARAIIDKEDPINKLKSLLSSSEFSPYVKGNLLDVLNEDHMKILKSLLDSTTKEVSKNISSMFLQYFRVVDDMDDFLTFTLFKLNYLPATAISGLKQVTKKLKSIRRVNLILSNSKVTEYLKGNKQRKVFEDSMEYMSKKQISRYLEHYEEVSNIEAKKLKQIEYETKAEGKNIAKTKTSIEKNYLIKKTFKDKIKVEVEKKLKKSILKNIKSKLKDKIYSESFIQKDLKNLDEKENIENFISEYVENFNISKFTDYVLDELFERFFSKILYEDFSEILEDNKLNLFVLDYIEKTDLIKTLNTKLIYDENNKKLLEDLIVEAVELFIKDKNNLLGKTMRKNVTKAVDALSEKGLVEYFFNEINFYDDYLLKSPSLKNNKEDFLSMINNKCKSELDFELAIRLENKIFNENLTPEDLLDLDKEINMIQLKIYELDDGYNIARKEFSRLTNKLKIFVSSKNTDGIQKSLEELFTFITKQEEEGNFFFLNVLDTAGFKDLFKDLKIKMEEDTLTNFFNKFNIKETPEQNKIKTNFLKKVEESLIVGKGLELKKINSDLYDFLLKNLDGDFQENILKYIKIHPNQVDDFAKKIITEIISDAKNSINIKINPIKLYEDEIKAPIKNLLDDDSISEADLFKKLNDIANKYKRINKTLNVFNIDEVRFEIDDTFNKFDPEKIKEKRISEIKSKLIESKEAVLELIKYNIINNVDVALKQSKTSAKTNRIIYSIQKRIKLLYGDSPKNFLTTSQKNNLDRILKSGDDLNAVFSKQDLKLLDEFFDYKIKLLVTKIKHAGSNNFKNELKSELLKYLQIKKEFNKITPNKENLILFKGISKDAFNKVMDLYLFKNNSKNILDFKSKLDNVFQLQSKTGLSFVNANEFLAIKNSILENESEIYFLNKTSSKLIEKYKDLNNELKITFDKIESLLSDKRTFISNYEISDLDLMDLEDDLDVEIIKLKKHLEHLNSQNIMYTLEDLSTQENFFKTINEIKIKEQQELLKKKLKQLKYNENMVLKTVDETYKTNLNSRIKSLKIKILEIEDNIKKLKSSDGLENSNIAKKLNQLDLNEVERQKFYTELAQDYFLKLQRPVLEDLIKGNYNAIVNFYKNLKAFINMLPNDLPVKKELYNLLNNLQDNVNKTLDASLNSNQILRENIVLDELSPNLKKNLDTFFKDVEMITEKFEQEQSDLTIKKAEHLKNKSSLPNIDQLFEGSYLNIETPEYINLLDIIQSYVKNFENNTFGFPKISLDSSRLNVPIDEVTFKTIDFETTGLETNNPLQLSIRIKTPDGKITKETYYLDYNEAKNLDFKMDKDTEDLTVNLETLKIKSDLKKSNKLGKDEYVVSLKQLLKIIKNHTKPKDVILVAHNAMYEKKIIDNIQSLINSKTSGDVAEDLDYILLDTMELGKHYFSKNLTGIKNKIMAKDLNYPYFKVQVPENNEIDESTIIQIYNPDTHKFDNISFEQFNKSQQNGIIEYYDEDNKIYKTKVGLGDLHDAESDVILTEYINDYIIKEFKSKNKMNEYHDLKIKDLMNLKNIDDELKLQKNNGKVLINHISFYKPELDFETLDSLHSGLAIDTVKSLRESRLLYIYSGTEDLKNLTFEDFKNEYSYLKYYLDKINKIQEFKKSNELSGLNFKQENELDILMEKLNPFINFIDNLHNEFSTRFQDIEIGNFKNLKKGYNLIMNRNLIELYSLKKLMDPDGNFENLYELITNPSKENLINFLNNNFNDFGITEEDIQIVANEFKNPNNLYAKELNNIVNNYRDFAIFMDSLFEYGSAEDLDGVMYLLHDINKLNNSIKKEFIPKPSLDEYNIKILNRIQNAKDYFNKTNYNISNRMIEKIYKRAIENYKTVTTLDSFNPQKFYVQLDRHTINKMYTLFNQLLTVPFMEIMNSKLINTQDLTRASEKLLGEGAASIGDSLINKMLEFNVDLANDFRSNLHIAKQFNKAHYNWEIDIDDLMNSKELESFNIKRPYDFIRKNIPFVLRKNEDLKKLSNFHKKVMHTVEDLYKPFEEVAEKPFSSFKGYNPLDEIYKTLGDCLELNPDDILDYLNYILKLKNLPDTKISFVAAMYDTLTKEDLKDFNLLDEKINTYITELKSKLEKNVHIKNIQAFHNRLKAAVVFSIFEYDYKNNNGFLDINSIHFSKSNSFEDFTNATIISNTVVGTATQPGTIFYTKEELWSFIYSDKVYYFDETLKPGDLMKELLNPNSKYRIPLSKAIQIKINKDNLVFAVYKNKQGKLIHVPKPKTDPKLIYAYAVYDPNKLNDDQILDVFTNKTLENGEETFIKNVIPEADIRIEQYIKNNPDIKEMYLYKDKNTGNFKLIPKNKDENLELYYDMIIDIDEIDLLILKQAIKYDDIDIEKLVSYNKKFKIMSEQDKVLTQSYFKDTDQVIWKVEDKYIIEDGIKKLNPKLKYRAQVLDPKKITKKQTLSILTDKENLKLYRSNSKYEYLKDHYLVVKNDQINLVSKTDFKMYYHKPTTIIDLDLIKNKYTLNSIYKADGTFNLKLIKKLIDLKEGIATTKDYLKNKYLIYNFKYKTISIVDNINDPKYYSGYKIIDLNKLDDSELETLLHKNKELDRELLREKLNTITGKHQKYSEDELTDILEKTNLFNLEFIESTKKNIDLKKYYLNSGGEFIDNDKGYKFISSYSKSALNIKAMQPSSELFEIIKTSVLRNIDGTYDVKSFIKYFEANKHQVLVVMEPNGKIAILDTSDVYTVEKVLNDSNTMFSIMDYDSFIKLTSESQPIELKGIAKFLHENFIYVLKKFGLYQIGFFVNNVITALIHNFSYEDNNLNPKTFVNNMAFASKMNHKWNRIYLDLSRKINLKERFGDVKAIEDPENFRILLKELNLPEDEINDLVDFHKFMSTASSMGETKEMQRNLIIEKNKNEEYERIKNKVNSNQTLTETEEDIWEFNRREPKGNFKTLKQELNYLKTKPKKTNADRHRLEFLKDYTHTSVNKILSKLHIYSATGLDTWLNFNNQIETIVRYAMYKTSIDKGLLEGEAAFKVIKHHFIYNDKSLAEKHLEILIPFISYPIRAAELFYQHMQDYSMVQLYSSALENIWDEKDYENSDYLTRRVGRGDIPADKNLAKIGNPFLESLNTMAQPLDAINNKLNPLLKPVLDFATHAKYNRWSGIPGISQVSKGLNLFENISSEQFESNPLKYLAPSVFNDYYKYTNYNYENRIYPRNRYSDYYTRGGHSRMQMRMQNTNIHNLPYRINDIMYTFNKMWH